MLVPAPSAPVAKPRRARGQATRAAILAAAGPIFGKEGLAGARTESIATAAGVNKALLFYYFKDLPGLYAAVLEDQFRDFHARSMEILTSPGSPRSLLLQYVDLHFNQVSKRRELAKLHHQFLSTSNPAAGKLIRKYAIPRSQALGSLLARGIREGDFRHVDVRHTAVSIIGLIVFYFSIAPVMKHLGHADAYSPAELKRRKQQVLEFIRYGLFLKPEAA